MDHLFAPLVTVATSRAPGPPRSREGSNPLHTCVTPKEGSGPRVESGFQEGSVSREGSGHQEGSGVGWVSEGRVREGGMEERGAGGAPRKGSAGGSAGALGVDSGEGVLSVIETKIRVCFFCLLAQPSCQLPLIKCKTQPLKT